MTRGLSQNLKHGHIPQGAITKCGNIQKCYLIGSLFIITACQVNRVAEIAHRAPGTHVILVALGDNQTAIISGAHIKAGNNAPGESGFMRAALRHIRITPGANKILKHAQTGRAAFFRVKLNGCDIALLNTAGERRAVISGSQYRAMIARINMIGMHEIKFFITIQAAEKRAGLAGPDAVPADMRHGQISGLKSPHRSGDKSQARHARCFLTAFKQGLQSQAYSQKGTIRAQILQKRRNILFRIQYVHHGTEIAHARKNQLFSCADMLRPRNDPYGLPGTLDGVDNAAHIAGSVIKYGDHRDNAFILELSTHNSTDAAKKTISALSGR